MTTKVQNLHLTGYGGSLGGVIASFTQIEEAHTFVVSTNQRVVAALKPLFEEMTELRMWDVVEVTPDLTKSYNPEWKMFLVSRYEFGFYPIDFFTEIMGALGKAKVPFIWERS